MIQLIHEPYNNDVFVWHSLPVALDIEQFNVEMPFNITHINGNVVGLWL